ncbi:hypothetical protein Tco_0727950 [Tanacetum coccineum]|uniref:Uncharacterized protein n=1 Tax=Tanacetum coccineum TaxID=301880 RepID=A0ABQ4YJR6_9ASTR
MPLFYGFTELHQIDTFYNSLTSTDQDSLNAAAGGNLLTKTPKDALTLIENKLKARTSRNRPVVAKVSTNTSTSSLTDVGCHSPDAVKDRFLKNTTPPPASVKAVEESCVTYAAVNYNQGNAGHRPPIVAHQVRPPGFPPVQNNQNRENNYNPGSNYFPMNKPLSSGPLPSNTVANPKGYLKAITTRSSVSYDGPSIPPHFSSSPKVVEREPEVIKDPVQPSIKKVQPPDVPTQAPTSEPVNAPKPKPNLPYPSRLNNQKLRERDDH